MVEAVLTAPYISQDDFSGFHAAHFSSTSVDHFTEQFLGPVEGEYVEETEDDLLGYYEDGVKRTLSDEQIAMFRHSEIQALLRDKRHAEEAREDQYESPSINLAEVVKPVVDEADLEDGELEDEDAVTQAAVPPTQQNQKSNKKMNSSNQRKQSKKAKKTQSDQKVKPKSFFKQNVKPDLRKRTWDKVDEGLGNLDYDGESSSAARAPIQASQRRRISYDDD